MGTSLFRARNKDQLIYMIRPVFSERIPDRFYTSDAVLGRLQHRQ